MSRRLAFAGCVIAQSCYAEGSALFPRIFPRTQPISLGIEGDLMERPDLVHRPPLSPPHAGRGHRLFLSVLLCRLGL